MTEPLLGTRVRAKLDAMAARLREATAQLSDPHLDTGRIASLQRELGKLQGIVADYEALRALLEERAELEALCAPDAADGVDADLRSIAVEEFPDVERRAREAARFADRSTARERRGWSRSAIVEIRAGTGGEEAALFARELRDVYVRFADRCGWKRRGPRPSRRPIWVGCARPCSPCAVTASSTACSFESGGHRVQRVPATENQGRIHTSAATVAVLPEVEDRRVRGQGLRHRVPGDAGFRARRTERQQGLERGAADAQTVGSRRVLPGRAQPGREPREGDAAAEEPALRPRAPQGADAERAEARRSQVGSGDRNERFRTYNYPQNRLTDHRLQQNFTLSTVLEGKLEPVIDALLRKDRERRIAEL
jgi:peptide chain release factor 1